MEKVLISRDFSSLDAECLTDTWSGKDRNMSEAQAKPRPVVPESVLKEEKISEWALKKNEEFATLKRKNVEFELRNIRMSMRSEMKLLLFNFRAAKGPHSVEARGQTERRFLCEA